MCADRKAHGDHADKLLVVLNGFLDLFRARYLHDPLSHTLR